MLGLGVNKMLSTIIACTPCPVPSISPLDSLLGAANDMSLTGTNYLLEIYTTARQYLQTNLFSNKYFLHRYVDTLARQYQTTRIPTHKTGLAFRVNARPRTLKPQYLNQRQST